MNTVSVRRALCVLFGSLALAACGSGGDDGGGPQLTDNPPSGGGSQTPYQAGTYLPYEQFENRCAAPVPSGNDIESGQRYGSGTVVDENNFLRSWSNDLYLWYRELPDINPATYSDPQNYFDVLKTSAKTASGRDKDQFHFTYPTPEWQSLSQSGQSAGYGAQWVLLRTEPPRSAVVAYVEPGSPAASAGIARGDQVISVDGVDLANGTDVATLNNGLFPDAAGRSHTFVFQTGGANRTVTLTSAIVTSRPVLSVRTATAATGASVGYILFNDHIVPAEGQLIDAVNQLRSNVSELVLDLRYNSGGRLAIASELAYMIGGARTGGRVFERLVFNDKHTTTDPVTGRPLEPMPFLNTANVDTARRGTALPTMNLQRVFVLTGPDTCSASESIINALRGVDMEVIQIGSQTCGKPYGFYPEDNCGTTYFTVQFKGVNESGFGDYADGFVPSSNPASLDQVRGCTVADDFTRQLGDPTEGRLAAALQYIANGTCPAAGAGSAQGKPRFDIDLSAVDGYAPKHPALTNRIITRE